MSLAAETVASAAEHRHQPLHLLLHQLVGRSAEISVLREYHRTTVCPSLETFATILLEHSKQQLYLSACLSLYVYLCMSVSVCLPLLFLIDSSLPVLSN